MSLETGTRIQDLVATNPVGATDFVSQGDDHLRLIKAAVKGSFPSLGATAVAATAEQINNLASLVALSIIGRAANSTGAPAAITAATNDRILRRVADALDFGQLTAGMFPNTVVPDAALSSNVPLKNAANTLTVKLTLSAGGSSELLELNGASPFMRMKGSGGNEYALQVVGSSDGFRLFDLTAGLERFRVNNAGNFIINAPGSGNSLDVSGVAGGTALRLGNANGEYLLQGSNGTDTFGVYVYSGASYFGSTSNAAAVILTNGTPRVTVGAGGGAEIGSPSGGNKGAGSVNAEGDIYVNNEPLGYKRLYLRDVSVSGNTAATDEGRGIRYIGSGGHTFTLDADVPASGVVMIINEGSAALTLAASSELRWFDGAGGGYSTGSRSLVDGGVAFAQHAGSGVYRVWGNGLS